MKKLSLIIICALIIILNCTESVKAQCYIHEKDYSGIERLYNVELSTAACDLKSTINNQLVNTDIIIKGYDLYPLMHFSNEYDGFQNQIDQIRSEQNQSTNYLIFIKTIDANGIIQCRPLVNLPLLTSLGYNLFEIEAIANEIQEVTNEEDFYAQLEVDAMERLMCYVNGVCEVDNPFALNGFQKINFGDQPVSYQIDGNYNEDSDKNVYDLAGIKYGNQYIRDNAAIAIESIIQSPAIVFTSDIPNQSGLSYDEQLTKATNYFETLQNTFVVWMHFSEGSNAFYKTKINLTDSQCGDVIDKVYESYLTEEGEGGAIKDENDINQKSNCDNAVCNNIFKLKSWSAKCCVLPFVPADDIEKGVVAGVIDGLAQTVFFLYDMGKGLKEVSEHTPFTLSWFGSAIKSCWDEGCLFKGLKKKLKADYDFIKSIVKAVDLFIDKIPELLSMLKKQVTDWLDQIDPRTGPLKDTGYAIGKIIFEIVLGYLTGGTSAVANVAKSATKLTKSALTSLKKLNSPEAISALVKNAMGRTTATAKKIRCKILYGGCFVKDTPVLMANNKFSVSDAKSLAVAVAMPIVAVPVQEVKLLDYAVAHKTVNEQNNLIAFSDEDLYLGLLDGNPYTSPQQRQRDKYELKKTDWYSVSFEQVNGTSKCHFALTDDWIKKQGYQDEKVVILNLPEQGINGPFRITYIKHIIPQKKPEGDAGDGYDWKPVTGLFEHQSNQVYEISFDSGEELGVTYQHPIYSTTAGDWRLAGELEIGEEVLTKSGNTKVVSSTKKEGSEKVYNLEVKELHNFLVGNQGAVVHNACVSGKPCDWMWRTKRYYGNIYETSLEHVKRLHLFGSGLNKSHFGSHITADNLDVVFSRAMQDFAKNGSNVKFIQDGYAPGKHWVIVDMSQHADLLDNAGNIGKYISASGITVADTKNLLITLDNKWEIVNLFPTNKTL